MNCFSMIVLSFLLSGIFLQSNAFLLPTSRKLVAHRAIKNDHHMSNLFSSSLKMVVEIDELSDSDNSDDKDDNRTDEEKGLTHGYEGNFKIGDKVRVKKDTIFWHVKPYMKDGFNPKGFTGVVSALALYGRKKKTLCSAITPIKVEFKDGEGIPDRMFERKWLAHFEASELEIIE
mmetsp:Transcript_37411/g.38094  ORF Transcript_37411/g.38094 Transcript_37411/m.38094 type:complete len:175 (+) Transcript_37411:105-629(+)